MHNFQGVVQNLCFESCFWSKKGVIQKIYMHFFGGVQGLATCCCMMLLDALEGCSKKPIKIGFF